MFELTKLEISKMEPYDLDKIKNDIQTDFDDFWTYEIFRDELVNNNNNYLVLRYDNEIIAFGGVKIILDEATLMYIVTKKSKRNQGFAKFLLKYLIDIAKKRNCTSITLEVNEYNAPAIKLYEKFGFKQVGVRRNYYKLGNTALLMTLDL